MVAIAAAALISGMTPSSASGAISRILPGIADGGAGSHADVTSIMPAARTKKPVVAVSRTKRLDPNGTSVRVAGRGFDPAKGIYVAFCVAPKPGLPPTPCGGGMDTTGATNLAHWISSNPPPYGVDLAEPFGRGGTFSVRLRVSSTIGDVDCRAVVCGIATRADHTRTSDRSQDTFVPVTFAH